MPNPTLIKHIWFDMGDTLAVQSESGRKIYAEYKYSLYSDVVGKPDSIELRQEYESLLQDKKSNSNIFYSLGKAKDYWAEKLNELDPIKVYDKKEEVIQVLETLRKQLPISLFTNSKPEIILPALGIQLEWFTNILDGQKIVNPKPALDGFYQMIALTGLPAENILYVGDHEGKDIIPAREVGLQTAVVWGSSDKAGYICENFVELLNIFNK